MPRVTTWKNVCYFWANSLPRVFRVQRLEHERPPNDNVTDHEIRIIFKDRVTMRSVSWISPSRMSALLTMAASLFMQVGAARLYAADELRYRVTFDQAQAHYVHVELQITPKTKGELKLFLPVWTPGSYLVREYAQHVDAMVALSKEGEPLPIRKSAKSEWIVTADSTQPIKICYRVYCNELSVRTNFADSEFAILNGAATFLTNHDRLSNQHIVTFVMRDGWQQSVSSMRRPDAGPPHSFVAVDYDELVDSPILIGTPSIHPFRVGDVTHFLVNQGGGDLWDGEQAAADAAKVVAEHQRMWGQVPYDRYFFLNLITESGGGLEHDNSTLLMTSRWSFRTPRSYKRWLGLVSHEFFHAWNVRRLRPAALEKYDYLGENYFDELWVAEGVTSYYDDLALVRCGLTTQAEYLRALSGQIASLQSTPGRLQQSLVESSHDTWIKFYRPNANSRNTSISYYTKGAVAAFLLDAEIRRATGNAKSLDDVMRLLYQRFAGQKGYTNDDVLLIASQVAGSDLSEWFQRSILSAEELDYDVALNWLGLKFKDQASSKEASLDSEAQEQATASTRNAVQASEPKGMGAKGEGPATEEDTGTPWIGLSTTAVDGRLEISLVTEDSPAFDAGLNVGDEILGINGYRVTSGVDDRLTQYKVGETADMLISRRGKLLELGVKISSQPKRSWSLEPVKKPSELQLASIASWLRQDRPQPTAVE